MSPIEDSHLFDAMIYPFYNVKAKREDLKNKFMVQLKNMAIKCSPKWT